MAILGIFRHLSKKVTKWEYLLKEDKIIPTLTVQYFLLLYISSYDFQTIMTQNGMEFGILNSQLGSFDIYYILLKPHEN